MSNVIFDILAFSCNRLPSNTTQARSKVLYRHPADNDAHYCLKNALHVGAESRNELR